MQSLSAGVNCKGLRCETQLESGNSEFYQGVHNIPIYPPFMCGASAYIAVQNNAISKFLYMINDELSYVAILIP